MARNCASGLTKTDRGDSRTIGYYLFNGKRVPRNFQLGYDRTEALQKLNALTEAWDNLPGDRGQKVWTDAAIDSALSVTVSDEELNAVNIERNEFHGEWNYSIRPRAAIG